MSNEGVAAPPNPAASRMALTHWRRLHHDDRAGLARAEAELSCDLPPAEEGFEEDENFIYLPVTVLVRHGDDVCRESIIFGLGENEFVTVEPRAGYAPFDRAPAILKRRPELQRGAHGVMYALLQATNSAGNQIVEYASTALEAMNDDIRSVTTGVGADGREVTTDAIGRSLGELNEKEELISRIQEGQLLLERAARYLRLEIDAGDHELREQLDTLISDIGSVKEHAGFEHDKVRYLQQSVMTTSTPSRTRWSRCSRSLPRCSCRRR